MAASGACNDDDGGLDSTSARGQGNVCRRRREGGSVAWLWQMGDRAKNVLVTLLTTQMRAAAKGFSSLVCLEKTKKLCRLLFFLSLILFLLALVRPWRAARESAARLLGGSVGMAVFGQEKVNTRM